MKLSPDLTRYVVRAGIVAIGTLLAVLDRRWIGRRVFAVLLVTHYKSQPFQFWRRKPLHGGRDHLRRVGTGSGRLCFSNRLAIR
jgi:hypothetical protein